MFQTLLQYKKSNREITLIDRIREEEAKRLSLSLPIAGVLKKLPILLKGELLLDGDSLPYSISS